MRCRYCYAWNDDGNTFYHGTDRETMTPEVGEAVVDLILKNAADSSLPLLTFHGGEPMLYFPLIKRVVEYSEAKAAQVGRRIRFSLATNGTLFKPDYADFFARHNVNVCISLDGDEQGNAMRVFPNNRPTFPVVVENLRRFRQAGCVVTTQSTVHHRNLNLVRAAKLAREMGAVSILFNLNREYETEHSLSELDVWQLMREFDDLIRWEFSFSQRQPPGTGSTSSTFVRNLDGYFRALSTRERRFYYCIYGSNAVSVAPNGDVYVCEYHMGNTKYALGNVLRDERPGHPEEYVLQLAVNHREPCRQCWARYICGGPCPYEGVQLFDDPACVAPKFCDLYRSTVETMIAAYALHG
jgi:uncharacterized protein